MEAVRPKRRAIKEQIKRRVAAKVEAPGGFNEWLRLKALGKVRLWVCLVAGQGQATEVHLLGIMRPFCSGGGA